MRKPTHWARLVPELLVTDIERSLDFFVNVIGFEILYGRPEEGFVYLELEGAQIMLERSEDSLWVAAPMEQPLGRGINLRLQVSTVEPVLGRLLLRNWPLFRNLHDAWYQTGDVESGYRQFLVQCPDGYLLRLFEELGERPVEAA